MHTSRITNASLVLTVVSACLGLVATGVPSAHAQTQPGALFAAVNKSQALIAGTSAGVQLSPTRTMKLAGAGNPFFQINVCQAQGEPQENLYQNGRALTDKDRVLVVTRLPRAALIDRLAE